MDRIHHIRLMASYNASMNSSVYQGARQLHFFNHQTHHRGQANTLLFQQGINIGVTDLLALIPDCVVHKQQISI